MARAFLRVHNLKILSNIEFGNGATLLTGEIDPGNTPASDAAATGSLYIDTAVGKTWVKRLNGVGPDKWKVVASEDTVDDKISTISGGRSGLRLWADKLSSRSGTTIITPGLSAPVDTVGSLLMTQTITPLSASSRFVINFSIPAAASMNNALHSALLFRDGVYLGGAAQTFTASNNSATVSFVIQDSPDTASPITYTIRYGTNTGTWYINRRQAENIFGGLNSGWQIQEY